MPMTLTIKSSFSVALGGGKDPQVLTRVLKFLNDGDWLPKIPGQVCAIWWSGPLKLSSRNPPPLTTGS